MFLSDLQGEKIFYLIKPTPNNLALYEAWSSSPNQSEVFFGDKVDKCYKCVVTQGTTLLIPTGLCFQTFNGFLRVRGFETTCVMIDLARDLDHVFSRNL